MLQQMLYSDSHLKEIQKDTEHRIYHFYMHQDFFPRRGGSVGESGRLLVSLNKKVMRKDVSISVWAVRRLKSSGKRVCFHESAKNAVF